LIIKDKSYIRLFCLGIFSLSLSFLFEYFIPVAPFQRINDLTSRYAYFSSRSANLGLKIVGVAVDDYSLNKIPERRPWKRARYAELIRILDREETSVIGLDFVFAGASEYTDDDRTLSEALKNSTSRVVLAYNFDFKNAQPIFPLDELKNSAYSLGMLNTPEDRDGVMRRLRSYIRHGANDYYSFSVQLAAAYSGRKPEELIVRLPLLKDKTFPVNYLIQEKDIVKVSFYEVINDLPGLKSRLGDDFLNGALVLVYPEARIMHDAYLTPLGELPGGIIHLNGAVDILSGRLLDENNLLSALFLLVSLCLLVYALRNAGPVISGLLTLGIILLDFWSSVVLSLSGLRFNCALVVSFCFLFFVSASFYRYAVFLSQILQIRERVTLDPLKNLLTLRYFYYRLGIEVRNIYFRKDIYLVFALLENLEQDLEGAPFDKIKEFWLRVSQFLHIRHSFWSVYSEESFVGSLVGTRKLAGRSALNLESGIKDILAKSGFAARVKIGYARLNKKYPIQEFLYALSEETGKSAEGAAFIEDESLAGRIAQYGVKQGLGEKLLESIEEGIEDKNKQLLSLIDELIKEHAKTKEAYFQIMASLVNALEARDTYTEGHSERVARYALRLAQELGWPQAEMEKLKKAALLHDLGKIGIPDRILHKRDKLTDEEFDIIKQHEIIGVKIIEPLKDLQDILPWILYHHERWDGTGYPHGIGADKIPEAAQILSLADVYDALTTGRDYKVAFSTDVAVAELLKDKGARFSPRLTDVFVELIRKNNLT
jgi:putative nucleotidyltransferase with HDIG domain